MTDDAPQLWVVIPVYNEVEAIAGVLRAWLPCLRAAGARLTVCVIDDGSNDGTGPLLDELASEIPELVVIRQANAGHGRACLRGYREALDAGASWVFQIDSDGQCDPQYWAAVWSLRENHSAIYGRRYRRDDGVVRWLISRAVSAVVLATMRTWVRDPNVPYRLMRGDLLRRVLEHVSEDTPLPNVAIAALQADAIAWVPIRFLRRVAGVSKLNLAGTARVGPRLVRGLREVRARRDRIR